MASPEKLKSMFPRGSADFFKANETTTFVKLPNSNVEFDKAPALDRTIPGKTPSVGRTTIRYILRRVRPLDLDNATGSTKDCTDGLCGCRLISGDDPTAITLIVEQEKVAHYSDERTIIEIEWPD